MDRKEFKDFNNRAKLLLSSMFKRRTTKIMILQKESWIFNNIEYKEHENPKKSRDDFYDYKPQVGHFCHLVFFMSDYFDDIRALFNDLVDNGHHMLIRADTLYSIINKQIGKSKEWKDVNLVGRSDGSHIYLDVYYDSKKKPESWLIGYVFGPRHTLSLYNIIHENFRKYRESDIRRRYLNKDSINKSQKYTIHTLNPDGLEDDAELAIALVDGATHVSLTEYCQKTDTNWSLSYDIWEIGRKVWDGCGWFTDDHVNVFSYLPAICHFPKLKSKQEEEKENNDERRTEQSSESGKSGTDTSGEGTAAESDAEQSTGESDA